MKQLQMAVRGRGANPARRFAVMALADHTLLTQKQIGLELKMSPSQVANLLQRRKAGDQLIDRWKGLLDENI